MHKPHDLYTPTELLFLSLPPEQLIWWVGFAPTDIDTLLGVPEYTEGKFVECLVQILNFSFFKFQVTGFPFSWK